MSDSPGEAQSGRSHANGISWSIAIANADGTSLAACPSLLDDRHLRAHVLDNPAKIGGCRAVLAPSIFHTGCHGGVTRHGGWGKTARRGRKPPEGVKHIFLATLDPDVIRDLKLEAIKDGTSASACLEKAARQWLDRRKNERPEN
jgi:hypothetical protein